jgi:hypothetical protein
MKEYVEQSEDGREQENAQERLARESGELLQELRIMIPGVQILFAFLLMVPFSSGFSDVTVTQRYVFFGTLLLTAIATAFLIAPSAHHRVLWRRDVREERLQSANRLTLTGLACLMVAMAGAVFLVSDVIFGSSLAGVATAAVALLFLYLWFVQPVLHIDDPD